MKILMVLESEFPPDLRVENEAMALAEAGHEVHLACSTKKNLPIVDFLGDIIIHRISMSSFIYKSSVGCLRLPFYFSFWRRFLNTLTDIEKFDAIHIHDLPLSAVGLALKKRLEIPLIIDLHENWPGLIKDATHTNTFLGRILSSNSQWKAYEQEMLKHADKIIVVIDEAKKRITGLDIHPEKISIVSNTINIEPIKLTEKTREDNAFTIFYGGGINKHRGLQVAIKAIRILSEKGINVKLKIVGDGSYLGGLKSLTEELNVNSKVIFFGYKPFNEMLEVLADSDAAIIPHFRTENNDATIPHKLFQYMYLEKPVISSDCIPLKRIIIETDSGVIYQNDSPEDLADIIEKIISEREIFRLKGRNGKKAVLEKYNWNIDKKRLTDAYCQLASQ